MKSSTVITCIFNMYCLPGKRISIIISLDWLWRYALGFKWEKLSKFISLLQRNEVKNSSWLENEGLRRCVAALQALGLEFRVMITDRHKQNEKYIRVYMPNCEHYFDIWHIGKGSYCSITLQPFWLLLINCCIGLCWRRLLITVYC